MSKFVAMPRKEILTLLIAFALSVVVRVPLLNKPLSAHHEFCTALVLVILNNWYTNGFAALHGGPASSFTGAADLYPQEVPEVPNVRAGVMYYFSHPPLAYDLPYLMFAGLGIAPNVLGLQLFNMLFHLLTTVCLYLLVKELHTSEAASRAPLFAAVLYLFMPAPLWFHSNAYMSDMFVQNFWVMHLVVVARIFKRGEFDSWRSLGLLCATTFLTMYTSWPGVFAAMAVTVLACRHWWATRDRACFKPAVVAWVAVCLALGLALWRYLHVVDLDSLIAYYKGRFAVRGSTGMVHGPWRQIRQILINYRIGYLPVVLVVLFIGLTRWRSLLRIPWLGTFVLVAGLPVLLEWLFLFRYAGHDFCALKGGVLLCGAAGMFLAYLRPRQVKVWLVIACVSGVAYFYHINPWPGYDHGRYEPNNDIGSTIAHEAQPDETVFTFGFTPEVQVRWYAKRTLFRIDSEEQARQLLRAQGTKVGVVFRKKEGVLIHERIYASKEPAS
ncbi:MAG: glycosyltransferase family 39 protein [Flavobacteriales bacterium]|nr:glycosyltransferase family 39 protein [Flavobacteriales bacterium]